MFDLIIRGASVVDPIDGVQLRADIAVSSGKIAQIAEDIADHALQEIPAEGLVAQPGVIDTHLHLAPNALGHRMAAMAGVTTCIEMAGPVETVLADMAKTQTGLNVAVLNAVLPGVNWHHDSPTDADIDAFIDQSLAEGALGIKLLGGHFPLTPEASAKFVHRAAQRHVYLAWHAGSTEKGSDLEGVKEAIALAEGHAFHLPHINAYCRGRVKSVLEECAEMSALLEAHPEIVTESYLSDRNGCPLTFDDNDCPRSKVVQIQLQRLGLENSRKGVEKAIQAGALSVILARDGLLALKDGEEGIEALRSREAKDGSFGGVNPALARLYFASAKREDATYLVDGISTDGGAIPRNVILEKGLLLVDFTALSLTDFAFKTSLLPARMLGLEEKGRLAPGFDADITLYDPQQRKAQYSVIGGHLA